ncbi:MAG: oligopeptide/dipeptide ABC transporter ATP-binding protein [Roseburia sp.]
MSVRSQVLNLLKDLHKERNLTYIFISHDLSVVEYLTRQGGGHVFGAHHGICRKEELYGKPLHPYTKALLSAIPVPDIHAKRDEVILQGELPSPLNPPTGCLFSTRCPMATDQYRHSRRN